MIVYVYELVHLDNTFHERMCYTKKSGVTIIIRFYQQNDKLPLPRWKYGNYMVINIHVQQQTRACRITTDSILPLPQFFQISDFALKFHSAFIWAKIFKSSWYITLPWCPCMWVNISVIGIMLITCLIALIKSTCCVSLLPWGSSWVLGIYIFIVISHFSFRSTNFIKVKNWCYKF